MPTQSRFQLQISERRLLLRLGDAACNLLATLIALWIWAWVGERDYGAVFILSNMGWFFLLGSLWFILASANDFYDLRATANLFTSLNLLLQITLQMLIFYLVIFFLSPRDALPRLFIFYYGLSSFILIALWRAWRPFLIGWTSSARRVIVVGGGWAAREIIEALQQEAPQHYHVVAVLADPGTKVEVDQTVTILAEGQNLAQVSGQLNVSEIIVAYGTQLPGLMFQQLMDAYEQGYTITPMSILYEQVTGRVPIQHVGEHDWNVVLPVSTSSFFNPYPVVKRLMDVILALTGSVIFAFMLPLISLALYLDSPGPIFYRQERVGKGGKPFKILKLRTMIPDAEQQFGPQWAQARDPRITRVGHWLRKTRLDEAPQLINVLRGEMSMVGPRPERAFFVDQLSQSIPFYRTRNVIKPGLTGWAQVRYSYGNTVDDALIKLQYDLYYIRHQSILLDSLILLRTIRKVLALAGQ